MDYRQAFVNIVYYTSAKLLLHFTILTHLFDIPSTLQCILATLKNTNSFPMFCGILQAQKGIPFGRCLCDRRLKGQGRGREDLGRARSAWRERGAQSAKGEASIAHFRTMIVMFVSPSQFYNPNTLSYPAQQIFWLSRNTFLRWWEKALPGKPNSGAGKYCITGLHTKRYPIFLFISLTGCFLFIVRSSKWAHRCLRS